MQILCVCARGPKLSSYNITKRKSNISKKNHHSSLCKSWERSISANRWLGVCARSYFPKEYARNSPPLEYAQLIVRMLFFMRGTNIDPTILKRFLSLISIFWNSQINFSIACQKFYPEYKLKQIRPTIVTNSAHI